MKLRATMGQTLLSSKPDQIQDVTQPAPPCAKDRGYQEGQGGNPRLQGPNSTEGVPEVEREAPVCSSVSLPIGTEVQEQSLHRAPVHAKRHNARTPNPSPHRTVNSCAPVAEASISDELSLQLLATGKL